MTELSTGEYLARIGVAFILGAAVGLEREVHHRPAGLRTHALVAVGAALITLVSIYGFSDVVGANGVDLDPSRIAAQVISGIGFIGAGTIIAHSDRVQGLTTAASMFTVAAIGLACGTGLYVPAVATTVLALIILVPFKYIEEHVFHRESESDVSAR